MTELDELQSEPDEAEDQPAYDGRGRMTIVLAGILVIAALVVVGTVGYLIGNNSSSSSIAVSESSVDAGFARDMSTHHTQAVDMASYARDYTSDPAIKLLARDIEDEQYFQIGEMQGWLDTWNLSRTSSLPAMSWMPGGESMVSNGLMPGMATPTQMTQLQKQTGNALDVDFLQLMLHHHQGGVQMAQYAADHATTPYVKLLASKMVQQQNNEIVEMEQMLRERGSSPLPPPS
jgi:uncharacterized protein (DUF305 family)